MQRGGGPLKPKSWRAQMTGYRMWRLRPVLRRSANCSPYGGHPSQIDRTRLHSAGSLGQFRSRLSENCGLKQRRLASNGLGNVKQAA
jgi:hypothetical protein